MFKRLCILLLIAGTCLGCDRFSKGVAIRELKSGATASFLGDALRLQYAENRGAMLSIGAELPPDVRQWLLILAVGAMLASLTVFVVIRRTIMIRDVVAAALVIGGGFGNVLDRVLYDGAVIDFLNIGVGGLRTAVFNVADISIVAGMAFFLLSHLREAFLAARD